MTNAGTINLPAAEAQDALDSVADNQFPVRILLRRGEAGNFTITRGARFQQGGASSGVKSYAFLRNQVREMVISRISGTGTGSIYNVDVLDGISPNTMVEKVRTSDTGFRAIAYLLNRYYNNFKGPWDADSFYFQSQIVSDNSELFIALDATGPSDTRPSASENWLSLSGGSSAPSYARNKGDTISINADETAAVASGASIDRTFDELIDAITIIGNATTDTTLTLNVADNADLTQFAGRRMTFKNDGRGGTSSIVINNTSPANIEFFHGSRVRGDSISSNTISLGYRQAAQLIFTSGFRIHVLYNQSGIDIDDLKERPYFRGAWAADVFQIGDACSHAGQGYLLLGGNKTASDTTNPANDSDWVQITGGGSGGSTTFATATQARALTSPNTAISPDTLDEVIEAFARKEGVHERSKMAIDRIMDAIEHADNAGSIDPIKGFDLMGLFFTRRTDIGHGDERWVFGQCDDVFELVSVQIGTDDNPNRTHNYGLAIKNNVIRYQHIVDPLDLDNLLGIVFLQYPTGTVQQGTVLIPRLTTPWTAGDDPLLATFTKSPTEVKITIPNRRNAATRSVTHLLVRAGRVSGINNTSSRSDIINATTAADAVYQEMHLPLAVVQGHGPGAPVATAIEYSNYGIAFANGNEASCNLRVEHDISNGQGAIVARAHHGASITGFNGEEFLAIYMTRGVGG